MGGAADHREAVRFAPRSRALRFTAPLASSAQGNPLADGECAALEEVAHASGVLTLRLRVGGSLAHFRLPRPRLGEEGALQEAAA
jgi:hypothetical protein